MMVATVEEEKKKFELLKFHGLLFIPFHARFFHCLHPRPYLLASFHTALRCLRGISLKKCMYSLNKAMADPENKELTKTNG